MTPPLDSHPRSHSHPGPHPHPQPVVMWPVPGGLMPPPSRAPYVATCTDRTIEGLFQGALTGGVWGSFVALQARRNYPEPRWARQVFRLVGGHLVCIGSLLGLFNGMSCLAQRTRTRIAYMGSPVRPREPLPEHLADSIIGGFIAGCIVSVPLNLAPATPAAAAAASAATKTAATSASTSAAGSAPAPVANLLRGVPPSAPSAPSASPPAAGAARARARLPPSLTQLIRRVRWRETATFGLIMAGIGALMHRYAPATPATAVTEPYAWRPRQAQPTDQAARMPVPVQAAGYVVRPPRRQPVLQQQGAGDD